MKIEQSFSIQLPITSSDSNLVVPFPSFPTISVPTGVSLISKKLEILNLQARVAINSQTPLELPSIPIDASSSDVALIGNNLSWGNARLQLDLLVGTPGSWNPVATESLVDVSPVPYRIYDLLSDYGPNPATIDPELNLAVKVYDVGFGGLESEDTVFIWGDFLLTGYLSEPSTLTVNETTPTINVNVSGGSSSTGTSQPSTPTDITEVALTRIATNYTIQTNDRIFLDPSQASLTVTAPQSPNALDEFEVIFGVGYQSFINWGTQNYNGSSYSGPIAPSSQSTNSLLQGGRFVFTGESTGWQNEPQNQTQFSTPGY